MIRARQENVSIRMASLLDRGEQWLRRADRLDYRFRRWLMPIRCEARAPPKKASLRSRGLLTELQAEIGGRLRAQYNVVQPVPPQLARLLREFERGASA